MSSLEFDQQTIDIVNALFEKLIRIKPAFKQAWPTDREFQLAKREWIAAFQRAEISSLNRIKKGIDRITDAPTAFIPSPGEFLALCKTEPKDIGAPSIDEAYKEAIRNAYPDGSNKTWSHQAVRHAYHKSDPFFLRTGAGKDTKRVFEKNYIDACDLYADNKNLNQIENKKTDTPENRQLYQEYWGELKMKKNYSKNPDEIIVLSYPDWLAAS